MSNDLNIDIDFQGSYIFVLVGDILVGKKGLILNILFVFIKSTVLRYFLMWISFPFPFILNLEKKQWDGQVGNWHFSQVEPVFRSEVSIFFHRNMWQI